MKTQMKAVWAILAMTTIWLTMNSSKINKYSDNQERIDVKVEQMIARLEQGNQEEETKTKSFKEAFAEARKEYGADDAFLWRGEVYSTNYAEENKVVENVASSNGWVLNSDDLDDYCATNDRDECGICGGDGALLWYADRDGDGLGDSGTTFSSCEQPNETK